MAMTEAATDTSSSPRREAGANADDVAPGGRVSLDAIELEAIVPNMEAALRVYTDHHFFGWTQGPLQNLIPHEVLFCYQRRGDSDLPLIDAYSTASEQTEGLDRLFRKESAISGQLIREWESKLYRPVMRSIDELGAPDSPLVATLKRLGVTSVVAHGTYDTSGRMSSFFVFACTANDDPARQAHLAEILVPFLHAAWVRAKVSLIGEEGAHASVQSAHRDLLTQREQEVLQWVYMGKSNIEIGLILGISSLTVKNHVQEILRRLNVQNRAQAVGKAFNLHILSC